MAPYSSPGVIQISGNPAVKLIRKDITDTLNCGCQAKSVHMHPIRSIYTHTRLCLEVVNIAVSMGNLQILLCNRLLFERSGFVQQCTEKQNLLCSQTPPKTLDKLDEPAAKQNVERATETQVMWNSKKNPQQNQQIQVLILFTFQIYTQLKH